MKSNVIDAYKKRRSYYNINKNLPILEDYLIALIEKVVEVVPDAFNMKSARVVVALGEQQNLLWDSIFNVFGGKVARGKIDSFKAGYGTILYFIDTDTVKSLQEQFPLYAANFEKWSEHANGMLQHAMWTALREQNIGASLQHYNPVIDDSVKKLFNINKNWILIAQMPFGGITLEPDQKVREDIKNRVIIKK